MTGAQESRSGIDLRDGLVVLVASVIAYVFALRRIRAAWIPAAFGGALAARDLAQTLSSEGLTPAFGLWLATGALLTAAALLFAKMVSEVRRNVRNARRSQR